MYDSCAFDCSISHFFFRLRVSSCLVAIASVQGAPYMNLFTGLKSNDSPTSKANVRMSRFSFHIRLLLVAIASLITSV